MTCAAFIDFITFIGRIPDGGGDAMPNGEALLRGVAGAPGLPAEGFLSTSLSENWVGWECGEVNEHKWMKTKINFRKSNTVQVSTNKNRNLPGAAAAAAAAAAGASMLGR
jgi:hypothetical protein